MSRLVLLLAFACAEPDETNETNDTPTPTPPVETTPPASLTAAQRRALEDAAESDLDRNNASGVSIAIWLDGDLVYAEGFGTRHPDESDPVTPATQFQIGSDTKKITALAALVAAERGDLALDDRVSDLIPGLSLAASPTWTDDATLHDLLSHQGGLYDYTPWEDDPDDDALAERAFGEFAAGEFAMAPPGMFYNYANPNFSIAGLAVETATGRPWADVVTDDLFVPLGLTRTVARKADLPDDDFATGTGYVFDDPTPFDALNGDEVFSFGTVEHDDETDNAFIRPAGLVWSTPTDMVRLGAFLLDGDAAVLSDALREEVFASQAVMYPAIPVLGSYGYGLITAPDFSLPDGEYATPIWLHGGNTLTMTSAFYVVPEARLVISILSNGYADAFDETLIAAFSVADLGPTSDPPVIPAADPLTFVGTWVDPFGIGTMDVTYAEPQVQVALPTADALDIGHGSALSLYADDLAFLTIDGAQTELTWIDGPDGPGQWVRSRSFVGERGTLPTAQASPRAFPLIEIGPRPLRDIPLFRR